MIRLYLTFPVLILLSACASGPGYDTGQVNLAISPRSAVAELDMIRGQTVLWGGVILSTINRESLTRLEVLAYPLNSAQLPQRERDPLGRFLLEHQGFLDPATYAEGRLVTTIGTVLRSDRGEVGGTEYTYPVIKASEIYLWPRDSEGTNRSRVHFGIGVGVGL
ncbi:MAG: Slp/YeaY family lipoprotein [Gammaproteobacteria bacterium]|jgi:outer membrane lipoprotein|nr:Slp/YeaY family lipoprotein [Gammaproteobacteria bacterium]